MTAAQTRSDESLGQLVGRLTSDLGALVRDEVQLAKAEITEDVRAASKAGGMFGGAALAGFLAVMLLSLAAAWGLAEIMPIGVAFLIVALLWAIAGAVLFGVGRQRMRAVNMKPEQTIETMQENIQWARQQRS